MSIFLIFKFLNSTLSANELTSFILLISNYYARHPTRCDLYDRLLLTVNFTVFISLDYVIKTVPPTLTSPTKTSVHFVNIIFSSFLIAGKSNKAVFLITMIPNNVTMYLIWTFQIVLSALKGQLKGRLYSCHSPTTTATWRKRATCKCKAHNYSRLAKSWRPIIDVSNQDFLCTSWYN